MLAHRPYSPTNVQLSSFIQDSKKRMWPFRRVPTIPVLRLSGVIGMASPLRPGLSLASLAGPIERTFEMSKIPAVALLINSPGGSPAQSTLIFKRIRQLAD